MDLNGYMHTLWYFTTDHLAMLVYGEINDSNREKVAKVLRQHVDLGKLTKERVGKSWVYRLPHLIGKGEHALKVSEVLCDILREFPKSKIQREVSFGKSRADAVVLLKSGDKTLPFILEVAVNETKDSLERKLIDYQNIREFHGFRKVGVLIIGDIDIEHEGVIVTDRFRKEICYGF